MKVLLIGHPKKLGKMNTVLQDKGNGIDFFLEHLSTDDDEFAFNKFIDMEKKADIIIFCGIYDYTLFSNNFTFSKPVGYIKNDASSLYHALLQMQIEYNDISNISIDGYNEKELISICDESQLQYKEIFKKSFHQIHVGHTTENFMRQIAETHKQNIIYNNCTRCVTCMSPVYEELKKLSIPVVLVNNTYENIATEYDRIIKEYFLDLKQTLNLAIIEIETRVNLTENVLQEEVNIIQENASILEKVFLFANRMQASVDMISLNHFVITATRANLSKETDNYMKFSLLREMKPMANSIMGIGIGMGKSMRETKKHAQIALLKSNMHQESAVYIVSESHNIVGPISSSKADAFVSKDEYCFEIAKKTGLSINTVEKLLLIYYSNKNELYTVSALAKIYGVTEKTMYKILSKLEDFQYVIQVNQKIQSNTGRPSRCFQLNFLN